MEIQQIRQVRMPVVGSNGRTTIEVRIEPEADAETLQHAGRVFHTLGNGVFDVPPEVGAQIVGPLFRDVTKEGGIVRRKAAVLSSAHKAERPVGQPDDAPLYGKPAEAAPEGLDPAEVAAAGLQEVELPEEPLGLPNAAGSTVAGEVNEAPQNPHADGELTRQVQGAQHVQKKAAKKARKPAKKAAKKVAPPKE